MGPEPADREDPPGQQGSLRTGWGSKRLGHGSCSGSGLAVSRAPGRHQRASVRCQPFSQGHEDRCPHVQAEGWGRVGVVAERLAPAEPPQPPAAKSRLSLTGPPTGLQSVTFLPPCVSAPLAARVMLAHPGVGGRLPRWQRATESGPGPATSVTPLARLSFQGQWRHLFPITHPTHP